MASAAPAHSHDWLVRDDDPADVKRLLWDPPQLHTGDEKKVDWLELFEDLIFVAIIAQLASLMEHGLEEGDEVLEDAPFGMSASGSATLSFSIFGCLSWNLWSNKMFYVSRSSGGDDLLGRALDVVGMMGLVVMSASMKGLHNHDATSNLCLGVAVVNLVLALKYVRFTHGSPELLAGFRVTMMFLGGCAALYAALSLVEDSDVRALLMPAEVVGSLAMVRPGRLRRFRAASEFYGERYGLLVLLACGEVVAVVASADAGAERSFSRVIGPLFGFVTIYTLFSLYFSREADAVFFHDILGMVQFSLLHVPLVLGVTAQAAALAVLLDQWEEHPEERVPGHVRGIACSATAVVVVVQELLNVVIRRFEQKQHGTQSAQRDAKMVFFALLPGPVLMLAVAVDWRPSGLVLALAGFSLFRLAFSNRAYVLKRRAIAVLGRLVSSGDEADGVVSVQAEAEAALAVLADDSMEDARKVERLRGMLEVIRAAARGDDDFE